MISNTQNTYATSSSFANRSKNTYFLTYLIPAALYFNCIQLKAQTDWLPYKKQSNTIVYTKEVSDSEYLSFKAVSILNATVQDSFKVLDDVNNYSQLFAYTHSSTLLQQNLKNKYVYIETNLPWPFSNEDMIYNVSYIKKEDGSIKVILKGEPNYLPSIKSVNRMQSATGYILLEPEENQTKITYVMNTEPAGNLPVWLANKNIHKLPIKTIENLKKILEPSQ